MQIEFQQVVEEYASSLYRLACSYCGNRSDAQDAVQEVFLKYLQRPPVCDGPDQLRAWLMTATANKCKDLLRSAHRRRTAPLEDAPAPPENADEVLDVRAALDDGDGEAASAEVLGGLQPDETGAYDDGGLRAAVTYAIDRDAVVTADMSGLEFSVEKTDEQGRVWLWCKKRKLAATVQILS